jgi:hypothetical protein
MMYGYGNGIGGWGYALTAIGMILFWGAVIYGIVALVRYTRRDGPQRREPAGPPAPEAGGCSPSGSPVARSTRTNTTSASPACGPRARQPYGDGRTSEIMPSVRYERPGPGNGRRLLLVIITVTLVSCTALPLTLRASLPAGIPPGGHHEDGPGVRA